MKITLDDEVLSSSPILYDVGSLPILHWSHVRRHCLLQQIRIYKQRKKL